MAKQEATARKLKLEHVPISKVPLSSIRPSAKKHLFSPARLERSTFVMSRLLEFFSKKELAMQIGHPMEMWASPCLRNSSTTVLTV